MTDQNDESFFGEVDFSLDEGKQPQPPNPAYEDNGKCFGVEDMNFPEDVPEEINSDDLSGYDLLVEVAAALNGADVFIGPNSTQHLLREKSTRDPVYFTDLNNDEYNALQEETQFKGVSGTLKTQYEDEIVTIMGKTLDRDYSNLHVDEGRDDLNIFVYEPE